MPTSQETKEYYALRAAEYEKVYSKPSRQESIKWLRELLQNLLAGKRVLEISCGTGYWTPAIAEVAESVLATDINESVLQIAVGKSYVRQNVDFQVADVFSLDNVAGEFDGGFSGFWWSHVSKAQLKTFLSTFHSRLQTNALVVFADNHPVADLLGTTSGRVDEAGNQYSVRELERGGQYEIIKNFPTEGELRGVLEGLGHEVQYFSSACYWCVSYRTNA
jgi:demethylmenaquinone methyltransferase/2-methoxy-6-polyprenyl-1,4-benzoquinol methylase